jgi:hypothetical protein
MLVRLLRRCRDIGGLRCLCCCLLGVSHLLLQRGYLALARLEQPCFPTLGQSFRLRLPASTHLELLFTRRLLLRRGLLRTNEPCLNMKEAYDAEEYAQSSQRHHLAFLCAGITPSNAVPVKLNCGGER